MSSILNLEKIWSLLTYFFQLILFRLKYEYHTECPGSSDPPEKIFDIFASENEVYTIYQLLRYFRLNIIRLQSKTILGHMNSIG